MTPIPARCARCDSAFSLFAVVEEGTGACPHCLQPLVNGDPGALLEWAAVVDAAQCRLSAAVHLLQQLGGHLIVEWHGAQKLFGWFGGGGLTGTTGRRHGPETGQPRSRGTPRSWA